MSDHTLLDGSLKLAGRLDARFFALLEAIDATGSINRAARAAGFSYRGAWLLLEAAANLATQPLLASNVGGSGGGGTQLTAAARSLLSAWHQVEQAHRTFLRDQEGWLLSQPDLAQVLRRMSLKTTARNQFAGTVVAVEAGPVTTQTTIRLAGGQDITATMTSSAARRLQLAPGSDAMVLVKSSAVVLVTDFAGYQLSARNQLAGTISRVDQGPVSTMVGLTLPGGAVITASVTTDAAQALELAVGAPATAVFKAYSVMVAVKAASAAQESA
jgi:molybdate transport system regulatory protein